MKHRINRPREIKSCQRCFQGKRKCDRVRPLCGRCRRLNDFCYYSPLRLYSTVEKEPNSSIAMRPGAYLELEPIGSPALTSIKRFKLLTDSSGVNTTYLPKALFPFYDTSLTRTLALNRSPDANDRKLGFDFSTWTSQELTVGQIKAKIPPKATCDSLVLHFFSSIFPLIPILDKEDFMVNYNTFWGNSSKFHDLNGLVLMHAVFLSAACSLQINDCFTQSFSTIDYESIKLGSFHCIENINHLLNIDNTPSIPCLTALTIIYYVSSMNCNGIAPRISLLLRYSHIAGLHRRISRNSGTTLKDLVYEYIVLLDSFVSYYYGLSSQAPEYGDEYVENDHSTSKLYSMIKFKCGKLWAQIIRELDKPCQLDSERLSRLQSSFAAVQIEVNWLNDRIHENPTEKYPNKWLVTEGRLCLRKAALLLRFSQTYSKVDSDSSANDRGLIIESLLLINEAFMKVLLALESNVDSLWFVRCSHPFESLYVIIANLRDRPNDSVNFAGIDTNIHYTNCPTINYLSGDLRKSLLPATFDVLAKIQVIWPLWVREPFEKIAKSYESLGSKRYSD